ncbi:hypothetical protein HDV64DRAFT_124691 [Trichoderma sp. TUCIM 5745]
MLPRSKDTLHAYGGLLSYAQTSVFYLIVTAGVGMQMRIGSSSIHVLIACFSISSATGVGLQTSIMALEEAEPAADQCGEECLFLIPPSLWNPAISIYISLSLITIR